MRGAVKLQESVGLDVVSDGEMRRLNFQDSFGAAVEGYDASQSTLQAYTRRVEGGTALRRWEVPVQEKGTAISHRRPVTSRLRLKRNVPLEEYQFRRRHREDAGESFADRPGPHQPAIRPPELESGLQGHGRVHGRRGRDPERR